MTVQWLAEALINLADILDVVSEESPQGAAMLAAEIESKTSAAGDPSEAVIGRPRARHARVRGDGKLSVRLSPAGQ